MTAEDEPILAEQLAYYRARASEYDEWFLRVGRYDRGEAHRRHWQGEVAQVEAALRQAGPAGDVLELACGTGLWTTRLASTARSVTAVDASPEVLALNRARVTAGNVSYLQADLFGWEPPATYDFVFFGFWLSHVPAGRFEAFWAMVRRALRPGGKAFFVDSLPAPAATAVDQAPGADGVSERRLNDGQTFRIVKVFHEPGALQRRLGSLGWAAEVRATPTFFLHGTVTPVKGL